jgi:hypothetical protein
VGLLASTTGSDPAPAPALALALGRQHPGDKAARQEEKPVSCPTRGIVELITHTSKTKSSSEQGAQVARPWGSGETVGRDYPFSRANGVFSGSGKNWRGAPRGPSRRVQVRDEAVMQWKGILQTKC